MGQWASEHRFVIDSSGEATLKLYGDKAYSGLSGTTNSWSGSETISAGTRNYDSGHGFRAVLRYRCVQAGWS
jgi:hypothetical protein